MSLGNGEHIHTGKQVKHRQYMIDLQEPLMVHNSLLMLKGSSFLLASDHVTWTTTPGGQEIQSSHVRHQRKEDSCRAHLPCGPFMVVNELPRMAVGVVAARRYPSRPAGVSHHRHSHSLAGAISPQLSDRRR